MSIFQHVSIIGYVLSCFATNIQECEYRAYSDNFEHDAGLTKVFEVQNDVKSLIYDASNPKTCFSSRIAVVFGHSIEVRCHTENGDVVGASRYSNYIWVINISIAD